MRSFSKSARTRMAEIKVIQEQDWRSWKQIRLEALRVGADGFKSVLADWENASEEKWRARFQIPGAFHVLAYSNGEAVGMASGFPKDDGIPVLQSMYVSPKARGQGISDKLIETIENWAKSTGASKLMLGVLRKNEGAAQLYLRHGFVKVPDADVDEDSPEYNMIKEL